MRLMFFTMAHYFEPKQQKPESILTLLAK